MKRKKGTPKMILNSLTTLKKTYFDMAQEALRRNVPDEKIEEALSAYRDAMAELGIQLPSPEEIVEEVLKTYN